MWMTVIVIAFAVAMVVGPVMLVRPTPGMAKLAKIRAIANKKGLAIRLDPSHEGNRGATYYVPLSQKLRRHMMQGDWTLTKNNYSHEGHFDGDWDWKGKGRAVEALEPILRALIKSLPDGVTSLELNAAGFGCFWDEACRGKPDEEVVTALQAFLNSAQAQFEEVL